MPRQCSICAHEQRQELDERIVAGNESIRSIAKHFAVSGAALLRHAKNHLAKELTQAQHVKEVTESTDLLTKIEVLEAETKAIKDTALACGNLNVALTCIDKQAKQIELYAKLIGILKENEINIGVQVNITEVVSVVRTYLEKYHPDAAKGLHKLMVETYETQYPYSADGVYGHTTE